MINKQIRKIKENNEYQNKVINIYGDESCHLRYDHKSVMVLGAIYCEKIYVRQICNMIKLLKIAHGINPNEEIKWTKIAKSNEALYISVVNYFLDEPKLHFRGDIVKGKENYTFKSDDDYDNFYYKKYFHLLNFVLKTNNTYNIFLDIKDTRSAYKVRRLNIILSNANKDYLHDKVKINIIRSHESQLIQLADIIIGALSYENLNNKSSKSKLKIVDIIKNAVGPNIKSSSRMKEKKFNIAFHEKKEEQK